MHVPKCFKLSKTLISITFYNVQKQSAQAHYCRTPSHSSFPVIKEFPRVPALFLLKDGSLGSSVKANLGNWISLKIPYVPLNRDIETAELWDILYFWLSVNSEVSKVVTA